MLTQPYIKITMLHSLLSGGTEEVTGKQLEKGQFEMSGREVITCVDHKTAALQSDHKRTTLKSE